MLRRFDISKDVLLCIGTYADFRSEFADIIEEVLPIIGAEDQPNGLIYATLSHTHNDFDAKVMGPFNGFDDFDDIMNLLRTVTKFPNFDVSLQ